MSAESTEDQIARLPAHARALISRLRRDLRVAQLHIADVEHELAAKVDPEADRVFYQKGWEAGEKRALPDDAQVIFRLGVGEVRVMIQKSRDGKEYLDVNADSTVVVHPNATNSIRLTHVARFDDL